MGRLRREPLSREGLVAEELSPVVVGVDGSDPSRVALRWAAEEAVRRGRPLRIMHALEPWGEVPFYPVPMMTEILQQAGGAILEQAIGEVRGWEPGLPVTTALVAEPASVALRRQAEEAYEVVVGHRGRGGFASLLLGSVSLHTAGYADAPVVVVRDGDGPERRRIVVGIDLSEHAATALRYAFEAAVVREASLRVIYAWCPPEGPYAVMEVGELAQVAHREAHDIVAPWRDRYPQVAVAEDCPRDHPVKALVAASADADLIVVAARGHTGLRLGSVSHGLIHHARCPVAVVPSGAKGEAG
ncbi:universal stress protein [Actinoallomurus iriomotensis]|uniref:Universal stress protein n=1 Tax=Actinoallomurus iriomotensis TaxID=478107 RepID=A0A9W6RIR9_9ACTN|nr:universal stress protein [Actinoallomurus iriomotensis]